MKNFKDILRDINYNLKVYYIVFKKRVNLIYNYTFITYLKMLKKIHTRIRMS